MIKPGSILLGGTFDTELNTRETHIEERSSEQPRRRIFKYNYPVFNPKSPSYAGNECNLIHTQFGYLVRTNSFRSECILAHSKSKTKTCPNLLQMIFMGAQRKRLRVTGKRPHTRNYASTICFYLWCTAVADFPRFPDSIATL